MNLLSPYAVAVAVIALLACVAGVWWWRARREKRALPLPREWSLAARPVFTADERRVYRSLRDALPHHVVLAKLPLVRFCQPVNPDEIAYWYELLGSIHVTFAVCSPNGRVLAAIDLDTERGSSRRVTQIKQAVLGACRVRYLRCPIDHLPSIAELQLLVPQNGQPVRAPQPAAFNPPTVTAPLPSSAPAAAPTKPPGRRDLWQDSSLFQDSFFASDSRGEPTPSGFGDIGPGRGPTRTSGREGARAGGLTQLLGGARRPAGPGPSKPDPSQPERSGTTPPPATADRTTASAEPR
jgi:hypothetical protein